MHASLQKAPEPAGGHGEDVDVPMATDMTAAAGAGAGGGEVGQQSAETTLPAADPTQMTSGSGQQADEVQVGGCGGSGDTTTDETCMKCKATIQLRALHLDIHHSPARLALPHAWLLLIEL